MRLLNSFGRSRLGTLWLLGWLGLAAWFGFGREWFKHNPAPAQAALNSSASRQALAAGQDGVGIPPGADATRLAKAPKLEVVAISQMRVGDQVPADNPTGEKDTEFGDTVDPPNWRKLVLLASKKDGSLADVELLRPLWWLEEQHAEVGGSVEISVPECGIEGKAQVLSIEPCPAIKHNSRFRIVTGTFKHQASKVLDLYVEGLDEPIGTTPNHPFWSEDRQTFVRADQLKEGERLRAFNGTPIVRRFVPLADPEPVFNLEVQCDHVYHVAKNGILVHNSSAWYCYEQFINRLYGGTASRALRGFEGGATSFNRIADNVIIEGGERVAIESKYVANWATSLYNPSSVVGQTIRGQAVRVRNVAQMMDYSASFTSVRYHTNTTAMRDYLTRQASNLGLTNISVFFTP